MMAEKIKNLEANSCGVEKLLYLCNAFAETHRDACVFPRGVAQLVSAPALGAGGPWFESRYPDQQNKTLNYRR